MRQLLIHAEFVKGSDDIWRHRDINGFGIPDADLDDPANLPRVRTALHMTSFRKGAGRIRYSAFKTPQRTYSEPVQGTVRNGGYPFKP